jgi:carboxymethylenebutenolidase
MGEFVKLTASDGHVFDAYVAKPSGEPIAALVVVQEIFGVNGHLRSVADGYAKDGFLVVAPALFDRYERGVDIGYEGADMEKAMSFIPKLDMDVLLKDTAAAIAYAREQSGKKTAVVGYCLGGSIAWLSSARLGVDAAVGYYGGFISKFAAEQPKSPIILHFGEKDAHITEADRKTITSAHPEVPVYLYNAGHGFNCDARKDYDAPSAKLARERSLAFLKTNLA